MLLSKFILVSRTNQRLTESGVDSLEHCLDQTYFLNYPYNVSYQYNSRGFRDSEWPISSDELKNSIWCFGDSFTVGLGNPVDHIWPRLLESQTGSRTINISMDGASNNWISRKIQELVCEVVPKNIIVQWSYAHRRELTDQSKLSAIANTKWLNFYKDIKDPTWPECNHINDINKLPKKVTDEIRDVHIRNGYDWLSLNSDNLDQYCTDEEKKLHYDDLRACDRENLINCINQVMDICSQYNINLIQTFIPNYADSETDKNIIAHLVNAKAKFVPMFTWLDVARDGHHYGLKTAEFFIKNIQLLISKDDGLVQN